MTVRVDHATTSGTFSLDGDTFDVDNNVWVVGDSHECVVIDAPHDAHAIAELIDGRQVRGIVLTHGHDDHHSAAIALRDATRAPVYLHPADRMLWGQAHGDAVPDVDLADGDVLTVGGAEMHAIHTPGHSPGSVSFHVPVLSTVFTGDTLFQGGPGATGRSFSSFATIIESIRRKLLTLPPETVVRTGHGDTTTVGAEAPRLSEWIDRGY